MKQYYIKLLCLTFCLFFSMSAFSAEIVTIGGLKYELNGSEAYVAGYEGTPTDVVIPETVESDGQTFRVTQILDNAFNSCNSITSLTSTGTNLWLVGDNAFNSCEQIKEVNLSCQRIGYKAFYNCSNLKKVVLSGVNTIGLGNYQEGVRYIQWEYDVHSGYTFANCPNLVCIDLGRALVNVSNDIFQNCTKISYIVIPSSCKHYYLVGASASEYIVRNYNFDDYLSMFSGCTRLQSIIYLGDQTSQCGSNATIYYPKDKIQWGSTSYDYQGKAPTVTFTSDMPAGFEVTAYDISALEKNVGTYTQNVPFTFANNDMSFDVEIPYEYTINPVTLKAKVSDASRQYGDANPQFSSTYTGFVNNEDASVVTSHGSYTTTATAKSDVGTYAIKQTGATAQNYVFEYEDGTLTVEKASLTMTANDKTMTYGGTIPTFEAKYEGLKNNEVQPVWITEPSLSTTATSASKVGTYPITISNAEAKNYQLTLNDGTLTIGKAELTVKADNNSRTYGETNPEFTLSYTGLKNDETAPEWEKLPTIETTADAKSPVGTYPISIKDAVAVNYNITAEEGLLTINKAALQITPKDATRQYGESNPKFELSYVGLKNNESVPEWVTEPIISTSATKESSVGDYSIQVTAAEARNYSLEKKVGTLTITKAPLTVGLNNYSRKYGEANPTFGFYYNGLLNGDITPQWTTMPTITTDATPWSDVGEYTITGTGGEMKNYEATEIASGLLTITPASLTIRANNCSRLYFEENPELSFSCIGFMGYDDVSVLTQKPRITTSATKKSNAGTYIIEIGDAESKNYTISYVKGQLTINKRQLSVSTKNYTRAYGEDNPLFELSYSGFVNNEDEDVLLSKPKATTAAKKDTDVGVYDIVIADGVAENYAFSYVGAKLTIEKAYQTLTWDQNLKYIKQYSQIELLATASSGLDVKYTVEGSQICSITQIGKKQYLDCSEEGETVIVAIQEGDKNYWQTTKIYKPITISRILKGDANDDDMINVADIVAMVNYVKKGITTNFNKAAADINGDGVVDDKDITIVNNIIMGKE